MSYQGPYIRWFDEDGTLRVEVRRPFVRGHYFSIPGEYFAARAVPGYYSELAADVAQGRDDAAELATALTTALSAGAAAEELNRITKETRP